MREEIPTLLAQNMFLSDEIKGRMLADYQTFDDEKVEKVLSILNKAKQMQDSLIKKALAKDPNLLAKTKEELHGIVMKQLKEKELVSRQEEERGLLELEEEMDQLFS